MTRFFPYLLLPLGVALLEFHGIQLWTVAVTGGWPGWFTGGILARVDRIAGLGNAVVPACAREAFRRLSGLQ